MKFQLAQSLTVFLLTLVVSHAAVDSEVYFKSVLPNTPVPKAIKDSLPNGKGVLSFALGKPKENFPGYDDAATDEEILRIKLSSLFYLEKDMKQGKTFNLHISKDTSSSVPPFVPREVANSLPFSSNKLQDIYKSFKVNPGSLEANLIKNTVNVCEKASNQKEDQYCATSLESMVDFASSKLGKRVKAVSTQVDGNESTPLQKYKVEDVRKMNGESVVVCHREYYGYAVHFCHKESKINAYSVSLVGENNGIRAKAISVCHEDSSTWKPNHISFQVLNLKPGDDVVCHFLDEDEVAWVAY